MVVFDLSRTLDTTTFLFFSDAGSDKQVRLRHESLSRPSHAAAASPVRSWACYASRPEQVTGTITNHPAKTSPVLPPGPPPKGRSARSIYPPHCMAPACGSGHTMQWQICIPEVKSACNPVEEKREIDFPRVIKRLHQWDSLTGSEVLPSFRFFSQPRYSYRGGPTR